jgi:type II secretory pathway pseudopilin PulG
MMLKMRATKRQSDEATKGKRGRLRAGYSFPEVMFAVVVLGIGFIMLAAVFPVAVRQSKLTADETRAIGIARGVVGIVTNLAQGTDSNDDDYNRWAWPTGKDTAVESTLDPANTNNNWNKPQTSADGLPLHLGNAMFPATGYGPKAWYTKPPQFTPGAVWVLSDPADPKSGSMTNWPIRPKPTPARGSVYPLLTAKGWDLIRGNEVLDNDPRFGWTILYRRDGDPNLPPSYWSQSIQLYIIVAQARGRNLFDVGVNSAVGIDTGQYWKDFATKKPPFTEAYSTANLYPRIVEVRVTNNYQNTGQPDGPGPDALRLRANLYDTEDSVTAGCYVVMQQSGKVYQLGNAGAADGQGNPMWEMLPGNDMIDSTENSPTGGWDRAYVLGRERDPTINPPAFKGPAQDIYLYTAIVSIKK